MNKTPENTGEQNGGLKTVEEQANFQGPWSLLLFSRLEDPEIRRQLLDTLEEAYKKSLTRGMLENILESNLEKVKSDTPISFDPKVRTVAGVNRREIMGLTRPLLMTGKPPRTRDLSIGEAHEKGHVLRWGFQESGYGEEKDGYPIIYNLSERFNKAFDFSAVTFPDKAYEDFRKRNPDKKEMTDDEIRKDWIEYDFATPMELSERMSQLKNYFGFTGHEIFTKEHLDYARQHFIPDTDFDNQMTQFFQAITPRKEEAFLELINSTGI